MKYFQAVVLRPPAIEDRGGRRGRRLGARRQIRGGRGFDRELLIDIRRFHPFNRRMPARRAEIAEEIGARLAVLAVRTHIPVPGRPVPAVTLRMRHALRMLAREGGRMSVGTLAEAIGVGIAAASQLSGRMRKRGLVTKTRSRDGAQSRDRRVCLVELTADGWRFVPRDEPVRRGASWKGPGDDELSVLLGRGTVLQAWPRGLRRRSQPPSPIEEGLACPALDPRSLLTGLRAVQATLCGFDYTMWEIELNSAVKVRRRHRRDRNIERHLFAALPRPDYRPVPRHGRWGRRRAGKDDRRPRCGEMEAARRLHRLLWGAD